ncbi:MAG: hypothetical protein VX228_09415, partial [Pseudomonadota bacterium]|nr:hypothetical protein [Pseudomonadota bacterium]
MTRSKATAVGFIAVLLWALLALFTVGSAPTPPLMLNALCFTIGGTLGVVWAIATGEWRALRNIPFKVYLFGSLSLFGYHALYFSALRLAPAAEAGLGRPCLSGEMRGALWAGAPGTPGWGTPRGGGAKTA